MKKYDPKRIEPKWQKIWAREKLFRAKDPASRGKKAKKYYALVEFPYPSGEGLHVGHVRSYTALDALARKRRMEGYNVLYPMGWDAFGLPAENYAIKTGQPPAKTTKKNISRYRRQLQALGFSFDWEREVNTTDQDYYRWTQWIFLQLFKRGLAYKSKIPVHWCAACRTGLANEEVVDGLCERCGAPTAERAREQWMLAITKYADRLIDDLALVDFPEHIKAQQVNWIGRKHGALIDFARVGGASPLRVFTTRPETISGVTFIACAGASDRATGETVINPATGELIPVWEAEYVMSEVGTGVVMGVPVHDERDREFANRHGLPIVEKPLVDKATLERLGVTPHTTYKLRDWVFSRQRYWGEPIPLIWCERCAAWQAVPERDLPVKLPSIAEYRPTATGESPLAKLENWVRAKCPTCGGPGRRETDTMPNWAGSSWYYLRYCDPSNRRALASPAKLDYWLGRSKTGGVDWYNGGTEHTTLHLLYSRFWHKFLYDLGAVTTPEPYRRRTSHGFILAPDGQKMSKSRGNVINPDDLVKRFGADALRVYEMFIAPFDQTAMWNENGLVGARRFLERVWRLGERVSSRRGLDLPASIKSKLHQAIAKISTDLEALKLNTVVSQLMVLANDLETVKEIPAKSFKLFVALLSPLAPHLAEELWRGVLDERRSVNLSPWPKADQRSAKLVEVELVIQVNGRVRDRVRVASGLEETAARALVLARPVVQRWLAGQTPGQIIYVPDRLINLVLPS